MSRVTWSRVPSRRTKTSAGQRSAKEGLRTRWLAFVDSVASSVWVSSSRRSSLRPRSMPRSASCSTTGQIARMSACPSAPEAPRRQPRTISQTDHSSGATTLQRTLLDRNVLPGVQTTQSDPGSDHQRREEDHRHDDERRGGTLTGYHSQRHTDRDGDE
jgi:hypothetical protein